MIEGPDVPFAIGGGDRVGAMPVPWNRRRRAMDSAHPDEPEGALRSEDAVP